MDATLKAEIDGVRREADRLFSLTEIESAVDVMAGAITADLSESNPVMLIVMNGGVVAASLLLTRLNFALEVDYIHLSRYGNETTGGAIKWIRSPQPKIAGRTVLLVDDLLDNGVTLQTARDRCLDDGATRVYTAVLVEKSMATRPGLQHVDYQAVVTPDRYLFGLGMDYKHYWRNADGIYAVRETT